MSPPSRLVCRAMATPGLLEMARDPGASRCVKLVGVDLATLVLDLATAPTRPRFPPCPRCQPAGLAEQRQAGRRKGVGPPPGLDSVRKDVSRWMRDSLVLPPGRLGGCSRLDGLGRRPEQTVLQRKLCRTTTEACLLAGIVRRPPPRRACVVGDDIGEVDELPPAEPICLGEAVQGEAGKVYYSNQSMLPGDKS